jgi:tetratricopeptide (TPR) repeat protein
MKLLMLLFALSLDPSPPGGSLEDAIRFYNKGQFKQATQLLVQLRSLSPNDPDVRLWLGKSYLKIRDWDNAVLEMEKTTELKPDAQNHLWLGRACGARAQHSSPFTALSRARRVVKEFETAKKLAPEDLDVRFDLLDFYLNAPGMVGGSKDKASAEAQAISKLNPRKGYVARSEVLIKDKKWDLAKKELIQATIDYPRDAGAFRDAANYLLGRQDFGGALQYVKKALALDKESKRSRLILAAATVQLGTDPEMSVQILSDLASGSLTDDDPSFEEVYYWLGRSYFARGDKTKSREAFASALDLNPDYEKAKEYIRKVR